MGSASSFTKEEVKEISGDLFSEQLWEKYSKDGEMSRRQLFVLKNTLSYSQKMQMTEPNVLPSLLVDSKCDKVTLNVGDVATDAVLFRPSGEKIMLSDLFTQQPLILNVGSCT